MARQVDGVWLPERVAGHPALELNNTFGGWGYEQSREYLTDYRVLVVLGRDVGLLDADESAALLTDARRAPDAAAGVLRDVIRLREALHAVVVADRVPPEAADRLRDCVSRAVAASRFRHDADGRLRLDGGSDLTLPLHRFALEIVTVLSQYPRSAIRPCADDRCGFVFLDRSGRRRWCEMAVCGNRAKARRYAQRHR